MSSSAIDLNWTDNSNNETGFDISNNVGFHVTVGPNVTTYQVNGLPPGTYECFSLAAYNSAGWSRSITACTATLPPSPSRLPPFTVSALSIPTVYAGYSRQATGTIVITESAAGSLGPTLSFSLPGVSDASWCVIVTQGDLLLAGRVTQVCGNGTSASIGVGTRSTVPSTLEIVGDASLTGPADGPLVTLSATAVGPLSVAVTSGGGSGTCQYVLAVVRG